MAQALLVTLVVMSKEEIKEETTSKPTPTKTAWSSNDEGLLIFTLLEEKRKGNWGNNNPKKQAWTTCKVALAGSEIATKSCHKDIPSIKSCWQQVSTLCTMEYMHAQGYMQLKQIYNRVKHIYEQSGWEWSHKRNLPKVKDEVWNNYLKVSDI